LGIALWVKEQKYTNVFADSLSIMGTSFAGSVAKDWIGRIVKMSNNSTGSSGGIGFLGLLALLFIAFKLLGIINWPWLWVFSPILIAIVLMLLYMFSLWGKKKLNEIKRKRD